ncbi:MAG: glycogen debranching protein [Saprospiraceae bacterium]|nr:glycogen debranching protein [Saprospiraceae bacterium]
MNKILYFGFPLLMLLSCQKRNPMHMLYHSDVFTIYKDKVVQGNNTAEVVSSTQIKSNYKSPASANFSRLVVFKVSINEKDNELPPGQDHWVIICDEHEAPVVTFGEKSGPVPSSPGTFLPANFTYSFKVDMSPVLKQFEEKGYYEAYDGSRVSRADFKGFYLAGGSDPLSWDFVNLYNKGLKLHPTLDRNIYKLTVVFNPYDEADYMNKIWTLSEDISKRPVYSSEQPIVDALFNLSTEEAIKNIEPDGTFRTGAKWGGVWTRDVSYSILLAFAYHEPEIAKNSLRRKVKRGRIIQDTGSGGAWPVSSDRTTWCLAAWEIYKVTGDRTWLDEIYPIVKNTLDDDYQTLYDVKTGMYCGESSFLDWREQTYPKWMDNRDIFVSQNLGTNVVHYRAHHLLAEMAKIMGEPFDQYLERAERIKAGINARLWMEDKGYYGQYLYGREALILSPRFEALGAAMAILFDVAGKDMATSIISKSPLTEFGATCIYPQIPGIPPYHNNGIWPFVQSWWNLAAAKTGNEKVLNHGLASLYRAAALFLTNYENMVAETGDFLGTEINSHRMLWSMAGNLAMVHRVFMGMEFHSDGLLLNPVIPAAYGGQKSLSNFKYRKSLLNISVNGHGNKIKSVTIDGNKHNTAFIPADWEGNHDILIEMANNDFSQQAMNKVDNHFSLPTVLAAKQGDKLIWETTAGAKEYRIYRNGALETTTHKTEYKVKDKMYAAYQVSAVDEKGYEGFTGEPVVFAKEVQVVEMEKFVKPSNLPYTNFSGHGFIEVSNEINKTIDLQVEVSEEGYYLLDFRYANGSGPWNTDNKCAIRSLTVNGDYEGVIVLPQRGNNEWSDWGFSNSKKVRLRKGVNDFRITFEDWNHNMNVEVNTAMLDYMRVIKFDE